MTRVRVMQKEVAIDVRGVSKRYEIYQKPADRLKQAIFRGRRNFYKEFWALKDVSFQVYKGETVGIVGCNGSGKSTLLQIISGILKPTKGEVSVNGRVAALLELGSGFNFEFTGKENIYMNAAILGLSKKEIDDLYDEIIKFSGIGDFINQPVKTYSSGMAVRLAFAIQAVVPKEILIVDEALAVGDEFFQRKCYSKIEEFKRTGGTILFVSHSANTIIELCDRALLLDGGELLLEGESRDVINIYHKIIFAPEEKRELIKEELRKKCDNADAHFGYQPKKERIRKEAKKDSTADLDLEETYDPGLVSDRIFKYETRGAEIFDGEIVTLDGRKVNILFPDRKYIWRYKVKFIEKFRNVRFGMMIRTVTGLELGGAATSLMGGGISLVEAGEIYQIEFTFVPRLNPGVYFLNAGVLAIDDNDNNEIYLDRNIDLAVFKILKTPYNHLFTGIMDFSIQSNVIQVSSGKSFLPVLNS